MNVLALLYALHTAVGAPNATQVRRPYVAFFGTYINTIIVCALLVYCGNRLRNGKWNGGAAILMLYLMFQCMIVLGIVLSSSRELPPFVGYIQITYLVTCVVTTGFVFTNWVKAVEAS